MNKKKVIIVGTGGLAREFTEYFAHQITIVGFLTNNPNEHKKFDLPGRVFPSEITSKNTNCKNLVIAIGNPKLKRHLHKKFKERGFLFPKFIHEDSIVSESVSIKEGVVISPKTIVGPNVNIGEIVYINYQVGIGHDTNIGAYTQINPGSQLGGCTVVKGDSLIGSNSTLLQNTFIERKITIGSGSIVLGKKSKEGTISPPFSKYLPFQC